MWLPADKEHGVNLLAGFGAFESAKPLESTSRRDLAFPKFSAVENLGGHDEVAGLQRRVWESRVGRLLSQSDSSFLASLDRIQTSVAPLLERMQLSVDGFGERLMAHEVFRAKASATLEGAGQVLDRRLERFGPALAAGLSAMALQSNWVLLQLLNVDVLVPIIGVVMTQCWQTEVVVGSCSSDSESQASNCAGGVSLLYLATVLLTVLDDDDRASRVACVANRLAEFLAVLCDLLHALTQNAFDRQENLGPEELVTRLLCTIERFQPEAFLADLDAAFCGGIAFERFIRRLVDTIMRFTLSAAPSLQVDNVSHSFGILAYQISDVCMTGLTVQDGGATFAMPRLSEAMLVLLGHAAPSAQSGGEYMCLELNFLSAEFANFQCCFRAMFVQEVCAVMSAKVSGVSVRIQLVERLWWKRKIQVSQLRVGIDSLEVTPQTADLPWYFDSFLESFPETLKRHFC